MSSSEGQHALPESLHQSNMTNSTAFIQIPVTVIEAFFPGYSLLAQFLLGIGIDISVIVSLIVVSFGFWTAFRFALGPIFSFLVQNFSSSITIDAHDAIFNDMLDWAGAQKSLQDIRALRAYSPLQYYDDDVDGIYPDDAELLKTQEDFSDDMIFNFNDWAARAPPKYRPHKSSGLFWHNRRVFRITLSQERVAGQFGNYVQDREWMNISVLASTTQPIKALIEEAREFHLSQETSTTCIRRPTPKSQRGRRNAWTIIATRPSRSMATVVLENEQKAAILKDINDFLHPRTARWYSNRGIPYRRGYLFHGPPGTGKTSLSFALAGVFGLDIFCLALSEASLTEEDLILLFNSLPKRCILLLEDIDSAGVLGRAQTANETEAKKSKMRQSRDRHQKSITSELKAGQSRKTKGSKSKNSLTRTHHKPNAITLSGLLNAIDGVTSPEGRLLLMTTNYINSIDPALIRPGRVDMQIRFDLANKQQIKDLFLRMYCADSLETVRQPTRISQILPGAAAEATSATNINREREPETGGSVHAGGLSRDQSHHHAPSNGGFPASYPDASVTSEPAATASASSLNSTSEKAHSGALPTADNTSQNNSNPEAITALAESFAQALPDLTFSPAEIQGFLLMRKNDPQRAVREVAAWRDKELVRRGSRGQAENADPGSKGDATDRTPTKKAQQPRSELAQTAQEPTAKSTNQGRVGGVKGMQIEDSHHVNGNGKASEEAAAETPSTSLSGSSEEDNENDSASTSDSDSNTESTGGDQPYDPQDFDSDDSD